MLTIEPARPESREDAFRLAFQHLPPAEQDARTAHALELTSRGELEPGGILVARRADRLVGTLLCQPAAGAGALIWPPRVVPAAQEIEVEDALVRHALAWLRQRGVRLVQALLGPLETDMAMSLERNGFLHVTRLWYMRHSLEGDRTFHPRLTYQPYPAMPDRFADVLLRTYQGSLDCPEVNDVRTIDEVLEGHRAQGAHDPDRWWLALDARRPVGVLLLTELKESGSWDLSYLGILPEGRRRGFGRELTAKALHEARQAKAAQLTLAVDVRNHPACDLYRSLGFEVCDEREVYLAILR